MGSGNQSVKMGMLAKPETLLAIGESKYLSAGVTAKP
jgi:hypothetical protein